MQRTGRQAGGATRGFRPVGWLVLSLALAGRPAQGQYDPVESLDTWTDPGLAGWSNSTRYVSPTNTDGYLTLTFAEQSSPALVECITSRAWTNLQPVVRVSFRFQATDVPPSSMRFYLRSAVSGRTWFLNLPTPAVGDWLNYEVPVLYETGWTFGPDRSDSGFVADMQSVDWLGIYVRRGATCQSQRYQIDDVRIQGDTYSDLAVLKPTNGTVAAAGEGLTIAWTGNWPMAYARVELRNGSDRWLLGDRVASPDAAVRWKTLLPSTLPRGNKYYVRVSSADQPWDYADSPLFRITAPGGANSPPLRTDSDGDGLPDEWEVYFGLSPTNAEDAAEDNDGDGVNNYGEYVADTDPNDHESVLKLLQTHLQEGDVRIGWKGGRNVAQYLESAESPTGPWKSAYLYPPPTAVSNELRRAASEREFYRVRVMAP